MNDVKILSKTVLFLMIVICVSCSNNNIQDKLNKSKEINLQDEVTAIFKQHCSTAGCHSGNFPKKKLSLEEDIFFDATVNIKSRQIDSLKLVDTKQPTKSYLLLKVKDNTKIIGDIMPEEAPPLKKEEIDTIEKCILSLKEQE